MKRTVKHYFRIEELHVSHKITEDPVSNDPTAHGWWELIFVKSGDLTYMVNGKEYRPGKNSLIITRPLDYHSLSFHSAEIYNRYLINFQESVLFTDVCAKLPPNVDVVSCDGNELLCGLFRKFDHYIEQFDQETVKVLLIHLIEEILYNAILIAQKSGEENAPVANKIISRAVRYIDQNITRPISVEEIARQLNITKSHLHHLFATHMKNTPQRYIVSKKLILAHRDLLEGGKPTEICASYGFPDYSSFYRHYIRYFGNKPSEAKKMGFFQDDGY